MELIPGKLYKLERQIPVYFDIDKLFTTGTVYKDSIILYLKEERNSEDYSIVSLMISFKDKVGFFTLHRDNMPIYFKEL